jgi:NAD(P)H-hydrate epimerase
MGVGSHTDLALSREDARRIDTLATERYAIPSILLMENAAIGLAHIAGEMVSGRGWVLIACGPGNNAGDGLALARHLHNAGLPLWIALGTPPEAYAGDAGANMTIVQRMRMPTLDAHANDAGDRVNDLCRRQGEPALVVDALFGTGLTRPVEGHYERLIETINTLASAGAGVLAVDVPSGLDADAGAALGPCVRATTTATFVAPKIGFFTLQAQACLGDVKVVDIGVPPELLAELGRPIRAGDHHDAPRTPAQPPSPRRGRIV